MDRVGVFLDRKVRAQEISSTAWEASHTQQALRSRRDRALEHWRTDLSGALKAMTHPPRRASLASLSELADEVRDSGRRVTVLPSTPGYQTIVQPGYWYLPHPSTQWNIADLLTTWDDTIPSVPPQDPSPVPVALPPPLAHDFADAWRDSLTPDGFLDWLKFSRPSLQSPTVHPPVSLPRRSVDFKAVGVFLRSRVPALLARQDCPWTTRNSLLIEIDDAVLVASLSLAGLLFEGRPDVVIVTDGSGTGQDSAIRGPGGFSAGLFIVNH